MQVGEAVAIEIAFGEDDFECPFPHESLAHNEKNKIPPEDHNSSDSLGRALQTEGTRVEVAAIAPPYRFSSGSEAAEAGFSPHHLIPGNEMWNNKGHALHAWIHKRVETKVKGDIGYENNAHYNGVDLPSHHKVSGWKALEAKDPLGQVGYAFAAMDADSQKRQFHDAHKAYSDLVWNALHKIAVELNAIADAKGCGHKKCSAAKAKPYDPPYGVLQQLKGVATRLRSKLAGDSSKWKIPLVTSRFAVLYATGGKAQEKARKALEAIRDEMGRPTG